MDDLLAEFLTETAESMETLDLELVRLERNPNDPELLGNIFRLVHTVKGTCGFLGLPRLEAVAHAAENVLGRIREAELQVTPEAISLVLESLDRIKAICSALEQSGEESDDDDSDLIAQLDALARGEAPAPSSNGGARYPKQATVSAVAAESGADPAPREESLVGEAVPDPYPAIAAGVDREEPPAPAGGSAPGMETEIPALESGVAAQSIRVSVDVLENLMTMVSELVLTRNQLMQIQRARQDSDDVAGALQTLNHIVSELQEGVMQTRMQPIGNAWAKLPRIVRDLALELGKKIDLQMFGKDTELDRQVLDLIRDPLTHMVRNSAGHGLEQPEERREAGKPEVGTITLNAFHEGGHIVIEVKDDGAGLDVDKIKQRIVASGLASEAEIEGMSDAQIHQYIFKPGFSTAGEVTNISGRGVGMDVVRTNIEKIGGTAELQSTTGVGTTFTIKIPLTLAIISALVVECAGERFAIPQISVLELVRSSNNSEYCIESINDAQVLRLRDRLLPLVSLRSLLHLDGEDEGARTGDAFIIVAQVGKHTFGIIVDRVFDTEEIVVKPVAPILRDIQLFAGNTILGDGSVIMILDPNGIAAASAERQIIDSCMEAVTTGHDGKSHENVAVLIFDAGEGAPKAVPLSLVARLEEFEISTFEQSNGQLLVQYRGQLMPLVPFDDAKPLPDSGRQSVLVFTESKRSMGLIVDKIVDIVETELSVELTNDRPGFIGSAVISNRATDIIDVGHLLTKAYPDWFKPEGERFFGSREDRRVLLVDDSPFFRNMLTPLLEVAGYRVTTAESADEALELYEGGQDFDVIISDIEMPGMSGFEFAEKVRAEGRWRDVPIVALSSYAAPQDLDRGRVVGFSDYVPKFDRDALLQSLSETLSASRGAA
ncbi:MAG: chemotaxis protein CheW [Alphaproteobacteria bacterium]